MWRMAVHTFSRRIAQIRVPSGTPLEPEPLEMTTVFSRMSRLHGRRGDTLPNIAGGLLMPFVIPGSLLKPLPVHKEAPRDGIRKKASEMVARHNKRTGKRANGDSPTHPIA